MKTNKTFKRVLTATMASAMVLAGCGSVFAAEEAEAISPVTYTLSTTYSENEFARQICMGCSDSATCGKNCHCNDVSR